MALKGVRVLEIVGLAPAPFCGMLLADFGASVVKVDRVETSGRLLPEVDSLDRLARGKLSVALDLKQTDGVGVFRRLASRADVLIEPFRPGVMERLGLGPTVLMADNPRLIFARLSGYGQTGPFAHVAGHDINYLALSGLLSMLGRHWDKPYAPLNLVADFGGGGLMCAFGILLALFHRASSGVGQMVDASMTEGAAYLGSWVYRSQDIDLLWGGKRGRNLLDSGFPLYDTYETKDGGAIAVGALEPQFQVEFLTKMGLSEEISMIDAVSDPESVRKKLQAKFRTKTKWEWMELFGDSDACVSPVLSLDEAPNHPQNRARGAFRRTRRGKWDPNPAPRLSLTPGQSSESSDPLVGQHSRQVLQENGFSEEEIAQFIADGVIAQSSLPSKL